MIDPSYEDASNPDENVSEPTCATAHPKINVHLLPELAHPHDLAGHWIIVVDVLRASSTIAAALTAGAEEIVPCLEVPEARQLAERRRAEGGRTVLLGGERNGKPIAGFQLGNSPAEYVTSIVAGATVVFTTTNGTRAMMRCIGAGRVLIGSFANLTAIVDAISKAAPPRVDVLCAGTDGVLSWEDTLFAGAVVDRLRSIGFAVEHDGALIAETAWRQIGGRGLNAEGLAEAFRCGRGGQNLLAIGRGADLSWAAETDRFTIVPELELADWAIKVR